jgi:hypothetical protein
MSITEAQTSSPGAPPFPPEARGNLASIRSAPAGTAVAEVEDRERAEAVTRVVGLYRAESEAELDGLLAALPLYEWMTIIVTGLEPHTHDPAAPAGAAGAR